MALMGLGRAGEPKKEEAPLLLTTDEIVHLLNTNRTTFHRHIRGHLERVEVGGGVRYTRSSVLSFINAKKTAAAS